MAFDHILAIAVCIAVLCASVSARAGQVRVEGIPQVEFSLDIEGGPAQWELEHSAGQDFRYGWRGYRLAVRSQMKGSQRLIAFRLTAPEGRKLSVRGYSARVVMPAAGLHAVTIPSTGRIARTLDYFDEHGKWPDDLKIYRCLIPEGFRDWGNSNCDAPFALITGAKGENRLAVGWAVADRACETVGAPEGDRYTVTIERRDDIPFTDDSLEDTLSVCTARESWLDVAGAYARTFDALNGRHHAKAPDWATEPVFCTWYCYTDHIDQDGMLKIARMCSDLGFGTILIDAGWDCRPDGGYIDFEHGILGDFKAVTERFPDLPAAIGQIHDMGLRVELWSAPFWQGRESAAYAKCKDWHLWSNGVENYAICPKHPGTIPYLRETFATVARTYGIDGMWLDGADSVLPECTANHDHIDMPMGQAFTDCFEAIRDGLRCVNPEAVTEARVLHANIHTKRGLDLVQPSDAPESYEVLRLAGIHIRPWAYDMLLKNDPMYWPKDADAATVGKFLATMVCNGVPALSVDFLTASEEHKKLTRVWLEFYRQHKETLLRGRFRLFGADYGIPDMMIVGKDEAVVYMRNSETHEVVIPAGIGRVILLNCTNSDSLNLRIKPGRKQEVQAYRPDWSALGEPTSVESKPAATTYPVPQGGAAIVEFN